MQEPVQELEQNLLLNHHFETPDPVSLPKLWRPDWPALLLYYDTIGLLSPSGHVKGEYRVYGTSEQERLKSICLYRKAGISLHEIKLILDNEKTSAASCLISRFEQLDRDILGLKEQQRVIANLLQKPSLLSSSVPMTKKLWVSLLKASGLSEEEMHSWHIQFERAAPDKHRAFLQFLQIPEHEINTIRSWSIETELSL